jgi:type IV pilus assembly protein PilV
MDALHFPVRAQRGSTLLEALIAVLILSFCALGYAAMQMQGLASNASALWRSKATQLAYEMADRLRANQGGVSAHGYDLLVGAVAAPACGTTSSCSPAQMAQLDFAQWRANVAAVLPEGVGVVCITSRPDAGDLSDPACDGVGAQFAIKLFWREKKATTMFATVVRP